MFIGLGPCMSHHHFLQAVGGEEALASIASPPSILSSFLDALSPTCFSPCLCTLTHTLSLSLSAVATWVAASEAAKDAAPAAVPAAYAASIGPTPALLSASASHMLAGPGARRAGVCACVCVCVCDKGETGEGEGASGAKRRPPR